MACIHYPLHKAVWRGDHNLVLSLLGGCDINQRNSRDYTPIILAIEFNHLEIVKSLLDNGADLEIAQGKDYPIHVAARFGNLDMFKLLLKNNANLDRRTDFDDHSIHLAAEYGHVHILDHLYQLGVDIDLLNKCQQTPLYKAVVNGYTDAVEFLIQKNANVNQMYYCSSYPLHLAARYGHHKITELLIRNDATINQKDYSGLTPLHFAARYGHFEALKVLYESGAHCDLTTPYREVNPLHLAAESGNVKTLDYFLSKGADINFQTSNGYTVLHIAVLGQNSNLIHFLLGKGADINIKTISGWTELNTATFSGCTPLQLAVRICNRDIINILIQSGANFEIAPNGKCDILELLLNDYYLSEFDKQNRRKAAEVIIKFAVLRNRHAQPRLPLNYSFVTDLTNFWLYCKQQMRMMDNHVIGNSTITQYQLLQAMFSDVQLASYLNNAEVSDLCNNIQAHIKAPPLYCDIGRLMETGIKRGRIRQSLLKSADLIITENVTRQLPPEIRLKIMDCLNTKELIYILQSTHK